MPIPSGVVNLTLDLSASGVGTRLQSDDGVEVLSAAEARQQPQLDLWQAQDRLGVRRGDTVVAAGDGEDRVRVYGRGLW